ncbi:GNAT family N-acetyltransferase [Candidatus Thorarchaeota archaeon]|nr:GNAT family N-acetyltransferase [Candidatus Thorarchaeota archaeon]TFG97882.1 MAG: GNAT family N-acetyltransferase [Candidatus Thorarchaeota archaeon]
MTSTTIRSIHLDDIECVSEIERTSFPSPWDEDIFFQLALSGGKYLVDESTVIIMDVIGNKKSVNGYVVWEEYREDNHGHILNLAVKAEFRKQGIGKKLLSHALSSMKSAGMGTCELEVRESNLWARLLYENAGMMAVDRSVGYYESEDAIIYAITFI